VPEAAAVPEIKRRMLDAGCSAPIIGDFHYNGHVLLTKYPECAKALDKYASIREMSARASAATSNSLPSAKLPLITQGRSNGVNGGSLNQEWSCADAGKHGQESRQRVEEIINDCMVLSALQSTSWLESGCGTTDHYFVQTSRPRPHHRVPRSFGEDRTAAAPGLTEAGMGMKGRSGRRHRWACFSTKALAIRFEFRLRPNGGDRREEVYAACELLQALGCGRLRQRDGVPGCGEPRHQFQNWLRRFKATSATACYLENAIRRR